MSLDNGFVMLPGRIKFERITLSEDGGEIKISFKIPINENQTLQVANHFTEYLSKSQKIEYGIYPYNPQRVVGSYKIMPADLINSDLLSLWELPEQSFYSIPFTGGGIDVSIIRDRLCHDTPEVFFQYIDFLKSLKNTK